jgi:hypothetical protein
MLGFNRERGHRDRTAAQDFWKALDAHIQKRPGGTAGLRL